MSATTAVPAPTEFFKPIVQIWETALQTGARIQEATQKNMEQAIRLMNESAQRNIELVEKAVGAAPAEQPAPEKPAEPGDLWELSLKAVRANAEATLASLRVLESWTAWGKKLGCAAFNGRT